jgi:AraC-like DNA-binding protein
MPQAIHISPIDNVVVALHPIAKGTLVEVDGLAVTALEDIPQGHKMAVKPIKNGENVIKYGFPIGHATADAEPGTWMHTHNVHTNLSGEVEYSYNPAPDLAPLPKVEPETFMGFRRKDGRAAIRNEIWIIPTVGCVNDIAKKMVNDNQDLVTGSVEGLYTFTHPFGCSQTGHDHAQTRKLLAALAASLSRPFVLERFCEQEGGSERALRQQFRQQTGMTINHYLRQLRICHAQYLLQHTERLIGDIAMQCGFEDSNYFSVVFSREIGMSPGQWRQRSRAAA